MHFAQSIPTNRIGFVGARPEVKSLNFEFEIVSNQYEMIQYKTNIIKRLIYKSVQQRSRRNDCSSQIAVGEVLLMSVLIVTSIGRMISMQ